MVASNHMLRNLPSIFLYLVFLKMICANTTLLLIVCATQFLFIALLLSNRLLKLDSTQTLSETYKIKEDQDRLDQLPYGFTTSAFCIGNNRTNRECRFQNLCYDKVIGQYVTIFNNATQLFGFSHGIQNNNEPLLDLSSVDNHTAKYFYYVNASREQYDFERVGFIRGNSILFHRFNPENLMHVIHDDLIPLFHTWKKYFPKNQVNFIFMDDRDKGPYFDLYTYMSTKHYFVTDFQYRLTCFEDVVIGISKTTTWYQYGFRVPQGPISKIDFPVTELMYFRDYFRKKINLLSFSINEERVDEYSKYIVFFARTFSRKIINLNQLIFTLSTRFNMPVHIVIIESENFADIINLVSNASIVIGVHGAHLITSLFMKKESYLVEIFPYAIPSENYTPYKTLANFLNINYIPWENTYENKTVTHADFLADLGGIRHLPIDKQKDIISRKIVPLHLCCKNPYWLFRIYQDTFVDIKEFISHLSRNVKDDLIS